MTPYVLLVISALAIATAAPALHEEEFQYLFTKWMVQHSKNYDIEEFFHRYGIFKSNLNFIREHNEGNHTYTVAMNHLGDLSQAEFAKRNALIVPPHIATKKVAEHDHHLGALPAIDWRSSGAVTAVKDQGQCGSCYSFAATGALEGAWKIKGKGLISLSEQNIIDCSKAYGNLGCGGGVPQYTFDWIRANGGIASEASYPYNGRDTNACKSAAKVAQVTSHVEPSKTDSGLDTAVHVGPVAVAIEADGQSFQFYSRGVYSDAGCGTNLDHAVLLVGSGTSGSQNYWIVKNSWSSSWGESGYVRMARGMNICGIQDMASYPLA